MGPTRDDMVLRGVSLDRLTDRRSLMRHFDQFRREADATRMMEGWPFRGDVKVEVTAAAVGEDLVELRVRDEGPGIPKPELKRIFKRFYRIHGPIATRVKGTGLGLFIVRSVAKRHGGRAWAESGGPGKGSTFVLQFPMAK